MLSGDVVTVFMKSTCTISRPISTGTAFWWGRAQFLVGYNVLKMLEVSCVTIPLPGSCVDYVMLFGEGNVGEEF